MSVKLARKAYAKKYGPTKGDRIRLADALSLRRMSRDRRGTAVGLRHWDGNKRVEYPIEP